MGHKLIQEIVNIDIWPTPDPFTPETVAITTGDLHANSIKFLYFLIRHGIVSLPKESYDTLVRLYRKTQDTITQDEFHQIPLLTEQMKMLRPLVLVRLIGDETADRGQCDYYVLLILDKLSREHQPLEILASNHGLEFIFATEAYQPQMKGLFPRYLSSLHCRSLINLNYFLTEKKWINPDLLFEMINRCYKPQILSYTFNEKTKNLAIFSHAPIDLHTIKLLAERLQAPINMSDPKGLMTTINHINTMFYNGFVSKNKVTQLINHHAFHHGYTHYTQLTKDSSIEFTLWNRDYTILHRDKASIHKQFPGLSDINIDFYHGHDSDDPTSDWGLDASSGKCISWNGHDFHQHGDHKVLIETEDLVFASRQKNDNQGTISHDIVHPSPINQCTRKRSRDSETLQPPTQQLSSVSPTIAQNQGI